MIKVRYFARLREQLARDYEELPVNSDSGRVGALWAKLYARGGIWAETFAPGQTLLVAVNQELADTDTPIEDGDEVAFFPPVTGG